MKGKGTNKVWRFYFLMVSAWIFFAGMTIKVEAQYYTSNTDQLYENAYYLVEIYADNIEELGQVISVNAENRVLKDVFEEVAQKAGLGIAFNTELDFLNRKSAVNYQQQKAGTILQSLLEYTDFKAAFSKTKEIVFVRQAETNIAPDQEVTKEISGQVVDAKTGGPLPGVNVYVEGTNTGTTTDADGRFLLTVADNAETLVFSFIGYERLELPIGDRSTFNVELTPDIESLGDVVVVGYGTQQKTEVTVSISSVTAEEIQNVPQASFESALQGKMAGVNVASSTGGPGSSPQITVRGTGSISAGNDPLIVVDGVPLPDNSNLLGGLESRRGSFQPPNSNPLAAINPKNIKSIEVLKDASSAAIYGS